jgi:hypothetical protein
MDITNKKIWLIMSKDRKFVAKGTPRNRELVRTDDVKDTKRYLTYSSKAKAEAGYTVSGFYGMHQLEGYSYSLPISDFLEAVECEIIIKEVH